MTPADILRPAHVMVRSLVAVLLAMAFSAMLPAAPAYASARMGRLVVSPEPGWPQWRGPRRDGVSDETGLLKAWPQGGPKLLWKKAGIGRGYSSPAITRGVLYITGDVGEDLCVFALELDGGLKWRVRSGRAWKRATPGSRSSCTIAAGRLFHMDAHGRAACLDAATGEGLWAVDVVERFGVAKLPPWGLAESLVVDGRRVIVTPAGRRAAMAALRTDTGETVWTCAPLGRDLPGAASPILIEFAGRRQVVGCTDRQVFGVDAATGRLLWSERMSRGNSDVATPLFDGDAVFQGHVDHDSCGVLRIDLDGHGARRAWTIASPGIEHSGAVIVGGRLYGAGHKPDWACVDTLTGQVRCRSRSFGNGAAIYADGRLYCLGGATGRVALVEPTDQGFRVAGRLEVVTQHKRDVWAHPVICDGRLYVRYHDCLYCYDIRK